MNETKKYKDRPKKKVSRKMFNQPIWIWMWSRNVCSRVRKNVEWSLTWTSCLTCYNKQCYRSWAIKMSILEVDMYNIVLMIWVNKELSERGRQQRVRARRNHCLIRRRNKCSRTLKRRHDTNRCHWLHSKRPFRVKSGLFFSFTGFTIVIRWFKSHQH